MYKLAVFSLYEQTQLVATLINFTM